MAQLFPIDYCEYYDYNYLAVDPSTINGTLISRKLQGSKNTFE